jgi:hypothetical protein
MTPEQLAAIRQLHTLFPKHSFLEELIAELDSEKERADMSVRTADLRWRQLDLMRDRTAEALLHIETLARNVAEYPDRIPMLVEAVGSLYERVNDGSIAKLPEAPGAITPTTVPRGNREDYALHDELRKGGGA